MHIYIEVTKYLLISSICLDITQAVTMKQFEQSMDMMRNGCAPKFKIPLEQLDKLRNGDFTEQNSEIKCYVKCVAQLAGTVTKKGEFSFPKSLAQVPIILPAEIQDVARKAIESCKEIQKGYKESCDKIFFTTKCVRDYAPESFKFP